MKILKLLFLNILLLIILAGVFEICLFLSFKKSYPKIEYRFKTIPYIETISKSFPRSPVGLKYKKRPIMLMGCSYIYGLYLDENHSPHYKLSEITKRPVFNYALPGKGFQHALYIIQNKIYDKTMKNPEYCIYVMMNDHIRRMYSPVMFSDIYGQPEYKIYPDGIVKYKKDSLSWYKKLFIVYYIGNYYYFSIFEKRHDIHQKNIFSYIRAMKSELEKQYPDIKFVLLLYDDFNTYGIDFNPLKKDGITVIQTKELTGCNFWSNEYFVSDNDTHPVEKVWDIVIPALAKRLKIEA